MKANSRRVVFTIFTLSLIFLTAAGSFAADPSAKLDQGLDMLKTETTRLGPVRNQGPDLYFGNTKMNHNYDIVDKVKDQFDVTTTLFVKQDESFLRISTNVITVGDIRAVGSVLDPNGKPLAALSKGERFSGRVNLFGKSYDAIYEPIRDMAGAVVGAYYVGFLVQ
jgi:hypothetical protein